MKELIKFLDKYNIQYTIEDGIIIADNIDLSYNKITHLPDSFGNIHCNTIDLSYNEITTLPESFGNLRCNHINLSYNKITHLPESFGNIRCENIYLTCNKITHLPESFGNLICNTIVLSHNFITYLPKNFRNIRCNSIESYNTGGKITSDIQRFEDIEITDNYVYCDGILFWYDSIKIIDRYKIYIGYNKVLVSLNDSVFAHAKTIRQGIADIIFKTSDRDKSKYKDLSLDTTLSIEDAIVMYRIITGACSGGVESFISNKTFNPTISIQEISDMLNNEFGLNNLKSILK